MRLWIKLLGWVAILIFGFVVLINDPNTAPVVTELIPTATIPPVTGTPTPHLQPTQVAGITSGREAVTVKRVIDGDTLELSDGRRLRYIGIDAPESVHPTRPVECIAPEATKKNKELVEGKQVELEKDVSETDRLGRLLRYVYVNDVMVNDVLVREGFAKSSKYPPDVQHQIQLDAAELSARQNQWGIWSGLCASATPVPSVAGETTDASNCTIKGNINSSGEKIYHLSTCGSYDNTQIETGRGEQYFCTEAEAQAAGWRKAGNC